MARGFTTVKLFPAEQTGGVGALKAFGGPFPGVRFNPTGGVSEANMGAYLALPNVVAVGGSWMAPAAEVQAGAWDVIEARARRTIDAARA